MTNEERTTEQVEGTIAKIEITYTTGNVINLEGLNADNVHPIVSIVTLEDKEKGEFSGSLYSSAALMGMKVTVMELQRAIAAKELEKLPEEFVDLLEAMFGGKADA